MLLLPLLFFVQRSSYLSLYNFGHVVELFQYLSECFIVVVKTIMNGFHRNIDVVNRLTRWISTGVEKRNHGRTEVSKSGYCRWVCSLGRSGNNRDDNQKDAGGREKLERGTG